MLQGTEQVEQLEFAQIADAGVQGDACTAVDHPVAVCPGEQFEQFAAALDRAEVFPFVDAQVAVVQPQWWLPGSCDWGLDQGQGVFGQVRGDTRIDHFDLAGPAFEGCIKAPPEHVEVALVRPAVGSLWRANWVRKR